MLERSCHNLNIDALEVMPAGKSERRLKVFLCKGLMYSHAKNPIYSICELIFVLNIETFFIKTPKLLAHVY